MGHRPVPRFHGLRSGIVNDPNRETTPNTSSASSAKSSPSPSKPRNQRRPPLPQPRRLIYPTTTEFERIDFKISRAELSKASRLLSSVRTDDGSDLVDLTCYRDNVKFVVTGREVTCPASVEAVGAAQFPVTVMAKLGKLAATFNDESPRIRIEAGRIRINSAAVSMPEIMLRKVSDRPIDIPDDAPIRDILALRYLFSQEELVASDLAKRYLAAVSRKTKDIASVTASLAAYGIPADTVDALIRESLEAHAETLRAMLKPTLISRVPN